MDNIQIGTIILDKGANPYRVGIVVEVDAQSFTIAHLKEFLSFENEHKWHLLSTNENYEYDILGQLPSNHKTVVELAMEYNL